MASLCMLLQILGLYELVDAEHFPFFALDREDVRVGAEKVP